MYESGGILVVDGLLFNSDRLYDGFADGTAVGRPTDSIHCLSKLVFTTPALTLPSDDKTIQSV